MNGPAIPAPRLGLLALAFGAVLALATSAATAVSFETNFVRGSFDSTVSVGLQWRMQGTSCELVGNDNGGCVPTSGKLGERVNGPGAGATSNPDSNYLQSDDGNLNFEKGDLVSSTFKGNHELSLEFPYRWSALGRFSWLYDPALDDTQRTELANDARNIAAHNVTLLDLWLAKEVDIAGRPAKVKVGNQVLSWGEDLFIYGGVNVINAIDLTRAHKPGVQLKEIFRPAPIASINVGVTDDLSLEGFWQFYWNAFRFDPVGTPFSTVDILGAGQQPIFVASSAFGAPPGTVGDPGTISNGANIPAGQRFTLADLLALGTVVPPLRTQYPPRANQFGFAVRWKPELWNTDTEWGLYYLHYNDKTPFIGVVNGDPRITSNPFGAGYFEEYASNRNLLGLSATGILGDWAIGAEVSYRPEEGVGIDLSVPQSGRFCAFCAPGRYRGYVDTDKWQAHLTGIHLIAPSGSLGWLVRGARASEGIALLEVATTYYPYLHLSGSYPYALPDYDLPTRSSTGFVGSANLSYPHVFGSPINFSPQLDIAYDIDGTSPGTAPFVEGRLALTPSLNFDYVNRWRLQLLYTRYSGGGRNNSLRDRDYLGLSISYSI